MTTTKSTMGQKELRAILATIVSFLIFAGSTIAYALSRIAWMLFPMVIFGVTTLVFLGFYISIVISGNKPPISKKTIKTIEKPAETIAEEVDPNPLTKKT